MRDLLVPRISGIDLLPMIIVAACGAIIAAVYGVAHDQLTYSISSEYFTEVKFKQFSYVDFGFGDRVFVCFIGALASCWMGLVIAWFLARRLIPNQPRGRAVRQIGMGFAIVFGCGILFGFLGYGYGIWRGPNANYDVWLWETRYYKITDIWAFVRVAYIHNASYLGGLVGLIAALWVLRPAPATKRRVSLLEPIPEPMSQNQWAERR